MEILCMYVYVYMYYTRYNQPVCRKLHAFHIGIFLFHHNILTSLSFFYYHNSIVAKNIRLHTDCYFSSVSNEMAVALYRTRYTLVWSDVLFVYVLLLEPQQQQQW